MIRKANISIPTPCHENWDTMAVADKTRFCGSCNKHVYDFTASSDREIIQKLNSEPQLCGRFLNTQLNRDLAIPREKSSVWIAAASSVFAFLNLGNHEVFAQEKSAIVQTDFHKDIVENATTNDSLHKISGVISDTEGTLPGANVIIKGTDRKTITDIDGAFSIDANNGEVIVVTFVGMKDAEIQINETLFYDIKMAFDGNIDLTMVGGITYKRRTFFGRIFHSIGNLFR